MIKLIIFDLDGVLVKARLIHYYALNKALAKYGYEITCEEHLAKYDGLPTNKKLQKLTIEKGLPENLYSDIWKLKQQETIGVIKQLIKPQDYISQPLFKLKLYCYILDL